MSFRASSNSLLYFYNDIIYRQETLRNFTCFLLTTEGKIIGGNGFLFCIFDNKLNDCWNLIDDLINNPFFMCFYKSYLLLVGDNIACYHKKEETIGFIDCPEYEKVFQCEVGLVAQYKDSSIHVLM